MVRLKRQFQFEAAHYLPTFPEGHKCRRMHGHSFKVDVVVEGQVDPDRGYLIDYGTIKELCEPVRRRLDHYLLNEIEGLENPTAESLARWVWERLALALGAAATEAGPVKVSGLQARPTDGPEKNVPEAGGPPTALPKLVEIVVHETCTNACHYRGE